MIKIKNKYKICKLKDFAIINAAKINPQVKKRRYPRCKSFNFMFNSSFCNYYWYLFNQK